MRHVAYFAAALCLPGIVTGLHPGAAAAAAVTEGTDRTAITRGLDFIRRDAAAWRGSRKCATCHHGTMTLWAFSEARRHGFPVEDALVRETRDWVRERLVGLEKPRDPRPGWNMVSTPAMYLAAMTRLGSGPEVLTPDELRQVARHVARHLEADGSLLTPATMDPPLPRNGPPPIFESREVLTLFAVLALQSSDGEPADVRAARRQAEDWLREHPTGGDLQAECLRLIVGLQGRRKPDRRAVAALLARANPDGGWGQLRAAPSDAYATGLALYTLRAAGVDRKRAEMRRGVAFLVAAQNNDGSWPIKPRAHPGAAPTTNAGPIAHYGACWAVLGLVSAFPADG